MPPPVDSSGVEAGRGEPATEQGPSPAPSGCFPRFFSRKKKGSKPGGKRRRGVLQQVGRWSGRGPEERRSTTPSNSPPPKEGGGSGGGSSIDSSKRRPLPPDAATPAMSRESSSGGQSHDAVVIVNSTNTTVAFKSPVVIDPAHPPALASQPSASEGRVSRQSSAEGGRMPSLRQGSGSGFWGRSLSRGLSVDEFPMGLFNRSNSSRTTRRSISKRSVPSSSGLRGMGCLGQAVGVKVSAAWESSNL